MLHAFLKLEASATVCFPPFTPKQGFTSSMKITHWIQELAGWALLLIGLYTFRTCFGFLNNGQVVEAGVGGAIGFAMFRGGMSLVRLSVATRSLNKPQSA